MNDKKYSEEYSKVISGTFTTDKNIIDLMFPEKEYLKDIIIILANLGLFPYSINALKNGEYWIHSNKPHTEEQEDLNNLIYSIIQIIDKKETLKYLYNSEEGIRFCFKPKKGNWKKVYDELYDLYKEYCSFPLKIEIEKTGKIFMQGKELVEVSTEYLGHEKYRKLIKEKESDI